MGLDPNSISDNTSSITSNTTGDTNVNCRFIDMPKHDQFTYTATTFEFLGVCNRAR